MGSEMTESGGHEQHTGTRSLGSLAATQGSTNSSGVFQTTYTASVFGGSYRVKARLGGMEKVLDFRVLVPNLASLGGGDNYNLIGARTEHPNNHYGTATALSNLPLIANDYKTRFYGEGAIPNAEKVSYNDMSLIYGGKFEVPGNWNLVNENHAEHRVGRNCDVRSINVPADRHAALEDIFSQRGSPNFLKHVPPDPPHWHLRF